MPALSLHALFPSVAMTGRCGELAWIIRCPRLRLGKAETSSEWHVSGFFSEARDAFAQLDEHYPIQRTARDHHSTQIRRQFANFQVAQRLGFRGASDASASANPVDGRRSWRFCNTGALKVRLGLRQKAANCFQSQNGRCSDQGAHRHVPRGCGCWNWRYRLVPGLPASSRV